MSEFCAVRQISSSPSQSYSSPSPNPTPCPPPNRPPTTRPTTSRITVAPAPSPNPAPPRPVRIGPNQVATTSPMPAGLSHGRRSVQAVRRPERGGGRTSRHGEPVCRGEVAVIRRAAASPSRAQPTAVDVARGRPERGGGRTSSRGEPVCGEQGGGRWRGPSWASHPDGCLGCSACARRAIGAAARVGTGTGAGVEPGVEAESGIGAGSRMGVGAGVRVGTGRGIGAGSRRASEQERELDPGSEPRVGGERRGRSVSWTRDRNWSRGGRRRRSSSWRWRSAWWVVGVVEVGWVWGWVVGCWYPRWSCG